MRLKRKYNKIRSKIREIVIKRMRTKFDIKKFNMEH